MGRTDQAQQQDCEGKDLGSPPMDHGAKARRRDPTLKQRNHTVKQVKHWG